MSYRPWGPLNWIISLDGMKEWQFIGVIGTEERSLCAWKLLQEGGLLQKACFTEIQDAYSEKYSGQSDLAMISRRSEFESAGGNVAEIVIMPLMAELYKLQGISARATSAGKSIVLDITCFPKRFFFPILQSLVGDPRVENLILTYTSPEGYAPEGESLYEDIEPWRTLPGFQGDIAVKATWIVSVGFLVESLHGYANDNQHEGMKVLIPFPAPLAALRRTWKAVVELEKDSELKRFEKFRVDALDMSAAFDRIVSLAGKPEKPLAFAPFGPKPTAAAMCLYSIQKNASVHYAQPTVYHPAYSRGIRNSSPEEAVTAYWVKHSSKSLYAI